MKTRNVALATMALATMALAACGQTAVPGNPAPGGPPVTQGPAPTNGPTGDPVGDQPTWDNAPTVDDMPAVGESWELTDEYEGWGPSGLTPCQSGVIDAETVLFREFTDGTGEWVIRTVTLGFSSAGEAGATHEDIGEWYLSCAEYQGDDYGQVSVWQEPGEIPVSDDSRELGDLVGFTGATVALVEEGSDIGLITNGMMIQVDDRVTWLIADGMGMDQNCGLNDEDPGGQCDVFALADGIAERLAG